MTSIAIEDGLKVAVLLPCHNEAPTIGAAVRGFAEALPGARIYVFDNNSTDDTARAASLAGARVFREGRQGKGNVVRRMFADIDADVYVMAGGDGNYDPADAPSLVNALVTEHVDMVVGTRRGRHDAGRDGQAIGSHGLTGLHGLLFGDGLTGALSDYRAFTRRFVKSFPAVSTGLEIGTEMSVHASQLMIPVAEIELDYGGGPNASVNDPGRAGSRLRKLGMVARLAMETRPFLVLSVAAAMFWAVGLMLIASVLGTFLETGLASVAAAIAVGLFIVGFFLAGCGLVLESIGRSRVEQKRILFLTVPGLGVQ
jgi:hypothetical protein